ncbi:hypothetical protein QTP88_025593 [Uroleucon formosanum]
MRKKKYRESQSEYVVESCNSTTIEPYSINTVREVVKRRKPKSKQFPFSVNIENCTNRFDKKTCILIHITKQQDAAEFISALISLYEPLHNSLLHQLQTIFKCF